MIPESWKVVKALFKTGDWWLRWLLVSLLLGAVSFGMFAASVHEVKTKAFALFVLVLGTVIYGLIAASTLGIALVREGIVGESARNAVNWLLGATGTAIAYMVVLTIVPAWRAPEWLLIAEAALIAAILLGLATGAAGAVTFRIALKVALLAAALFLVVVLWRSVRGTAASVGAKLSSLTSQATTPVATPQPTAKTPVVPPAMPATPPVVDIRDYHWPTGSFRVVLTHEDGAKELMMRYVADCDCHVVSGRVRFAAFKDGRPLGDLWDETPSGPTGPIPADLNRWSSQRFWLPAGETEPALLECILTVTKGGA